MRLLGRNTKLLGTEIPLEEAQKAYSRWFAVVVDPQRGPANVESGTVCAVSKTRDGAFRALYNLGPVNRKVTVTRLP